ncbi:hypothetical protein ACQKM2_28535 [Streptomyces sp. NPDC004126]|uniref:hypothetical protein n=1 Tax=Streptomyces sp. NPDC004126 TaxID=3390695 RepID=UPI003D08B026
MTVWHPPPARGKDEDKGRAKGGAKEPDRSKRLSDNPVNEVAFSPDGRTLAVGTSKGSPKNRRFGSPYDDGCRLWRVP